MNINTAYPSDQSTHQLHAHSSNEGAGEHGKPGTERDNVEPGLERLETRCGVCSLEEVGQRKEAEIDDRELPKQPLLRCGRGLVEILSGVDLPVQLSPTSIIFLDHNGNDEE